MRIGQKEGGKWEKNFCQRNLKKEATIIPIALYHRTSDIGQDGLVSIASAACKDNGSQLLSRLSNTYFMELMQQLYCSSFRNNGNYTTLVLSLDNTVISVITPAMIKIITIKSPL